MSLTASSSLLCIKSEIARQLCDSDIAVLLGKCFVLWQLLDVVLPWKSLRILVCLVQLISRAQIWRSRSNLWYYVMVIVVLYTVAKVLYSDSWAKSEITLCTLLNILFSTSRICTNMSTIC